MEGDTDLPVIFIGDYNSNADGTGILQTQNEQMKVLLTHGV